jgi:diguanylate cyclase (GGDEF)-like protein/PAS domain S-box-containing protein
MKSRSEPLQLLVIDDEQTTAARLIDILKNQNIPAHFNLLDDQEEFSKAIRNPWDVILFGHAYDLNYASVIETLAANDLYIPVIAMTDSLLTGDTSNTNAEVLDGFKLGLADIIPRAHLTHIAFAITREFEHAACYRKARKLFNQFREAEQRAQLLVKNSKSAVAYIHDGVHIYTNETYNELFGYHSLEDLIGQPVVDLIGSQDIGSFKDFLRAYSKGSKKSEFQFTGIKSDSTQFDALLQLAPASYEGEECTQIIIQQQIENNAVLVAELERLNRIDKLTGLSNRTAFEEVLSKKVLSIKQTKQEYALLFISIDNIGHINASAGLAGSDAVTLGIAQLMKDKLASHEIFRFGESGFTVLLNNSSAEHAVTTANQLCQDVQQLLISVDKRTVQATISVGAVMINEHSPDSAEVLDRAYHSAEKVRVANNGSGNGVYLYNPAENANSSNSALREILENAINRGQLKLMFQHIYDTFEEDTEFFEVYVRLPVGDKQLMTPNEFLAVAQQYKLEGRMDRWVLLNAAKQLKAFMSHHPHARLLINLGAESIQDNSLVEMIKKLLGALGNPAHHPLVLQFNEANISTYLQVAKQQINALHEVGCQVSINDFGSSLNSVNILNHLNVDMVKIDKSYMLELAKDENFEAVQHLVKEVQPYNVKILASYIESTNDIAKAWSLGAHYLQGFYFQKPTEMLTLNHEEQV